MLTEIIEEIERDLEDGRLDEIIKDDGFMSKAELFIVLPVLRSTAMAIDSFLDLFTESKIEINFGLDHQPERGNEGT